MTPSTAQAGAVRRYYDRNTARFLRFGQSAGTQNIHRAVWAEGVRDLAEAVNFQNQRVLSELGKLSRPDTGSLRVLDLGCGVGSTAFYLAQRYEGPVSVTGVSISPRQVALATRRCEELGLSGRCSFAERDFHNLHDLAAFDLAYAIEAFVHAAAPEGLFAEIARHLVPGGRLLLCDDFLTDRGAQARGSDAHTIETFKAGWLAPSVLRPADVSALAAAHGLRLIGDEDLTAALELGRLRDKAVAAVLRVIGPLAYKSNYLRMLKGGDALQTALRQGLVSYRVLVFEKSPAPAL